MCGFLLNLVQIYNNTYTTENCLFKNYRLIKVPAKIHEILNRIYTQENHLNNTIPLLINHEAGSRYIDKLTLTQQQQQQQ